MFVFLFCLILSGCATAANNIKPESENRTVQLEAFLLQKDEDILRLNSLLEEKERQLEEKNIKIQELRKKLEMFGVFEK